MTLSGVHVHPFESRLLRHVERVPVCRGLDPTLGSGERDLGSERGTVSQRGTHVPDPEPVSGTDLRWAEVSA